MRLGGVYKVYTTLTKSPKDKFFLCVSVSEGYYFIINSEPRRRAPDAQVRLDITDLAALHHVSYIDTSQVWNLSAARHRSQIEDPENFLGYVDNRVKLKVTMTVRKSKYIPKRTIDEIVRSLSPDSMG